MNQQSDMTDAKRQQPNLYHFEYTNIHNHRLALIRRIDLWHQIAYTAIAAISAISLNTDALRNDPLRLSMSLTFGVFFVMFAAFYGKRLDDSVARTYPRLIVLERKLDYRFWHEYISSLGNQEAYLIQRLDVLQVQDDEDLVAEVYNQFKQANLPLYHRHIFYLLCVDFVIILGFLVIVFYQVRHIS